METYFLEPCQSGGMGEAAQFEGTLDGAREAAQQIINDDPDVEWVTIMDAARLPIAQVPDPWPATFDHEELREHLSYWLTRASV